MRPLELTVRNFRSYFGEEVTFNFRDRGLVGIVGPIGSGKSSLLEAVAFALYARTASVGKNTMDLIHQRADRATVSLQFSVGGEVWKVTRSLRSKGQSQHGLAHLSADDPDAKEIERIVMEREVNQRIIDLLGLDYSGFSRSVMLAQGSFAEFLKSQPAERDRVLKGVFGHDKIDAMRQRAKERVGELATEIEVAGAGLIEADRQKERLLDAEAELVEADVRAEQLTKAKPTFVDLTQRQASASDEIKRTGTLIDEWVRLATSLPPDDEVTAMAAAATKASQDQSRAQAAMDGSNKLLKEAEGALEGLMTAEKRRSIETVAVLDGQLEQSQTSMREVADRQRQNDEAVGHANDALEASAQELDAIVAQAEECIAAADEADCGVTRARDALNQMKHADALAESLCVGETCPVCDQVVAVVPPREQAVAFAAEQHLKESLATHRAKQSAAKDKSRARDTQKERNVVAQVELDAAKKAAAMAAADFVRYAKEVKSLEQKRSNAGGGDISTMRRDLEKLEEALTLQRKAFEQARGARDDAVRCRQSHDKKIEQVRGAMKSVAAILELPLNDGDSPAEVSATASKVRDHLADGLASLERTNADAQQEMSEVKDHLRKLKAELDVDDFSADLAEAAANAKNCRKQVDKAKEVISELAPLQEKRRSLIERHKLFDEVARELTDSRFLRYLLDEEKRALADLGSERFQQLSSGRYRFSGDSKFDIVDLASADAVRKTVSLSGGETFLASLALALALAEMVTRLGGRLDSFFLDEGFGSLDQEHLDLAMDGVEQLVSGSSDRLVLVVSHVVEMRDRMEDLIELNRHAATGDTRVVRN